MKIFIYLFILFSFQLFASTVNQKTELSVTLSLVSSMSDVVHSLQQERGASCGYISSDGKRFNKKLKLMKINSNEKIKILHTFFDKNQEKLYKYFSKDKHDILEATFNELYNIRKDVIKVKVDFAKVYSKYTQSISLMLMNISDISEAIENKKLSDVLYNYSILLMYKESVGQKRAALSALFSQKIFSKEIFEYYMSSNIQEHIYLKSFLHDVDEPTQRLYHTTLDDISVEAVKKYEKLALDKLAAKQIEVDAEKWFICVTKKINLIQSIEHKLFQKIVKQVNLIDNLESILLTTEEKEWIKTHTVSVGVEQWAPVVFLNDEKNIDGICGDFTKKLVEKTGLKLKIIHNNWDILLQDFQNKKIDLLPATYYTDARAKYGLYSDGYFKMKDAIFLKNSNKDIKSLKDLEGKTLAIPKGYGTIDKLQKKFPKIKLVFTKDLDDSINRVLDGRVIAFYEGQIAAEAKINDELIKGLKSIAVKAFKAPTLHYFSKIDEPLLQSIIQKGLDSINYQERSVIVSKWAHAKQEIDLSISEQKWLDKEEAIKYVFDPDWQPFEWVDSLGNHKGIVSDIIKLIKEKSEIKFIPVHSNTWTESIQKIKLGDAVMLSATGETATRKAYLNFTEKSIYITPYVFVSKISQEYVNGFKDLKGKRLEVLENSTIEALLHENKANLKFNVINTVKEGFDRLQNDASDVLLINGTLAKYYINTLGYKNLKIAYKTDYNLELKIALRKDVPAEVLSIINKSIDLITEKEIDDIVYKWTELKIHTKTDWIFIGQISTGIFFIILFILYNNFKLKSKVDEKTKDLKKQKDELEGLIASFDKNVIFTRTDLKGIITHASDAFCEISGYTKKELVGKPHNIVRHPDMPSSEFEKIWKTLKQEACITADVKNLKKDGGFYWLEIKFEPEYDIEGKHIGFNALKVDITDKKEVEELSSNLEEKVALQTKNLRRQKEFTQTLLDSQEQMIITTDGETLLSANETFFDFFAVGSLQDFMRVYKAKCICETFNKKAPKGYLQVGMGEETWIDYVISHSFDEIHKVMISMGSMNFIFSVTAAKLPGDGEIKSAVFTNITEMEKAKAEIEAIHKHTRESIEYAALIQSALIPDNNVMRKYFKDQFVIWHPKDTVGGDIYLFEELRHKDECLLMVIDCTGHGVPGAFVTMLVKAIERQITAKINHGNEVVSPAKILSIFNKNMKQLLKQEDRNSISNAGFDGQVIYYNKKDKVLKTASARNEIFYYQDDELHVIKGDRHSVGYKDSNSDYEFTEHIINTSKETIIYISSDGYWDQNGGEKGFPFGKKRFKKMLDEIHNESMADQQEIFLYTFENYKDNHEVNDDVTVIGLKI